MKLVWMPPRCWFLMFACLKFFSFISGCNVPGRGGAAGAAATTEIPGQAWAVQLQREPRAAPASLPAGLPQNTRLRSGRTRSSLLCYSYSALQAGMNDSVNLNE